MKIRTLMSLYNLTDDMSFVYRVRLDGGRDATAMAAWKSSVLSKMIVSGAADLGSRKHVGKLLL